MILNYILYNYYFMFCEFLFNGRKKENLPVDGDPAEARWGLGGWKLRVTGGWRSHGDRPRTLRGGKAQLSPRIMQNNSLPAMRNKNEQQ